MQIVFLFLTNKKVASSYSQSIRWHQFKPCGLAMWLFSHREQTLSCYSVMVLYQCSALVCTPNFPKGNVQLITKSFMLNRSTPPWLSQEHKGSGHQAQLIQPSGFPLSPGQTSCASHPFPALLLFSGHVPTPQCPSCSEGPKTGHRIWGVASPVPSTGGWSLPWSFLFMKPKSETFSQILNHYCFWLMCSVGWLAPFDSFNN